MLRTAPAHAGALGLLGILRLTAGHADEAAALLEQALKGKPREAMLLGALGLARLMQGNAGAAEESLRSALKWGERDDPMVRMRLGMALSAQGRAAEATNELRRALALSPGNPDVMLNLANALADSGQSKQAEEQLRQVIARWPNHGDARFNLGTLLMRLERLDEAASEFTTLLTYYPTHADVHNNLGIVYERQAKLGEAAQAYRKALELDAGHLSALNNLGNVLRAQGQGEEAARYYAQAMERSPGHADGYLNMGMLRAEQGRLEEARGLFEKALSVDPLCSEAAINLSLACKDMADPAAAIAAGRRAVQIAPQSTEAHRKLAHALLWAGDLREGWVEYEWRLRESRAGLNRFALPVWHGERGAGVRLLLWNEQGVGDEILYLGLVAELADSGTSVTVEVDKRLAAMVARSIPAVNVIPKADPPQAVLTEYTHQSTLASVAQYLRPELASFQRKGAYLIPDQTRAQSIRSRALGNTDGFLVGLCWLSANTEVGRQKSVDLMECKSLLQVPGTAFLNLQYGDVRDSLRQCAAAAGKTITYCDDIDLYADLEGLAAACAACDLVVSVSSVAAHVAGAMGREAWLLVPKGKGRFWYWFYGMKTSPWYPSLRVFEQHALGQWQGVLDEVSRALADKVRPRQ